MNVITILSAVLLSVTMPIAMDTTDFQIEEVTVTAPHQHLNPVTSMSSVTVESSQATWIYLQPWKPDSISFALIREDGRICALQASRWCIFTADRIDEESKREQELNSLKRIDDSFRKIVIVSDDIAPWTDDNGICYIGLFQFLQEGLHRPSPAV